MIDRSYYPESVAKLIDHGPLKSEADDGDSWFDYVGHYGFDEIDVVCLLDLMAENVEAGEASPNERDAPIHACRALAQMGDMVAEGYFRRLIEKSNHDALVRNATAALPRLARAHLANLEAYFYASTMTDLERIGVVEQAYEHTERFAPVRDQCVAFLMTALAHYARYSADLNGFLVYYLVELKATEASEVIQVALASGKACDELAGSWPAVQVALKLASEADFSPDELLCAEDRQLMKEQNSAILLPQKNVSRQAISTITGRNGGYSIAEHIKRR